MQTVEREETTYSIPSSTMLYQQLLAKTDYNIISKDAPEIITEKLSDIQTKVLIEFYKKRPDGYYEYQLTVKPNAQEIFETLHKIRLELFQDLGCIPLHELSHTYFDFTFQQQDSYDKSIQKFPELTELPVSYRAELLYASIVQALYKETSQGKKTDWTFSDHLIFNSYTQIYQNGSGNQDKINFWEFAQVVREKTSPSDLNHFELYVSLTRTIEPHLDPYAFSTLRFSFLNLSIESYENQSHVVSENDIDLLSKDTRALFSYLQYDYLLAIQQLIPQKTLASTIIAQHPSFFYNKNLVAENQRDFLELSYQKEQLTKYCSKLENLPNNQLYQCIVNDIEQKFNTKLNDLLPDSCHGYRHRKIKLCWKTEWENLTIVPIQMDAKNDEIITNGFMTLGFTRDLAINIQDYFNDVFPKSLMTPVARCRPEESEIGDPCYTITFKKHALDYLVQSNYYHHILFQRIIDDIETTHPLHAKDLMHANMNIDSTRLINLCWERVDSGIFILPMSVNTRGNNVLNCHHTKLGLTREASIEIEKKLLTQVSVASYCKRMRDLSIDSGYQLFITNDGLSDLENYYFGGKQQDNEEKSMNKMNP